MRATKTTIQTAAILLAVMTMTACVTPQQRAPQPAPEPIQPTTAKPTWLNLPLKWWEDENVAQTHIKFLISRTEEELLEVINRQSKETLEYIHSIDRKEQTFSREELIRKAMAAEASVDVFLWRFPQSKHYDGLKAYKDELIRKFGATEEEMDDYDNKLRVMQYLEQRRNASKEEED